MLNTKTLEYRRLEFNPITFLKLINNETTIDPQTFFKPYKNNYYFRSNNRKNTWKYHFNNVGWKNSFFYRSVKMWNQLLNELVSCKNLKHFRLKLRKFEMNKIYTSKISK